MINLSIALGMENPTQGKVTIYTEDELVDVSDQSSLEKIDSGDFRWDLIKAALPPETQHVWIKVE